MHPQKRAQMMAYLTRSGIRQDLAGGGMLVQPSADGSRPGYRGEEGAEAIRLKQLKAAYDTFGKNKLDEAAKTLGFTDYAAMKGQDNANFRRKIKTELTEFGSVLPDKQSRSRSRIVKRIPKEQGIQIKLIEATNTKNFFDPKAFAKENKISMATLKDQADRLQKNIYKKRIVEASRAVGKKTKDKLDWIPNDSKFSDNALNKLWKSKLIKYEREKIDELFFDAFGRAPTKKNPNPTYNPKKFLAIKKNLNEYRQLKEAINKKYPNINFELDHPLSKSSLNKLFNATTDQLTFVNPLTKDLNNGFKDSLSLQYEKAVEGNNLNKKKAVEKIARDLKLNIGKISDDATNFKYGVKEFQKLDIKEELLKAVRTQADLSSNFKTYVKDNPDLFKTAGVSTKQTFTKIKPSEVKGVENLLAELAAKIDPDGCGRDINALGGRVGLKFGSTFCATKAKKRLDQIILKGTKDKSEQLLANKILKTSNVLKDLTSIRGILGPAALAFTAATEAGLVGFDMLAEGKTFREAVGDNIFNYALGPKLKIDSAQERNKRFRKLGVSEKDIGKISAYEGALRNLEQFEKTFDKAATAEQRLDEATDAVDPTLFPGTINELQKNLNVAKADVQDLYRAGDLYQRLAPAIEPTGLAALQEAQRLATIDKLTSAGPKFFGKIFPKSEESRQQRILDASSVINPAFDFPGTKEATGGTLYGFAGGGIAGLSGGDKSGPPPESGPMSQGLPSLLKRGRNL
jgi:hypothetical protein